MSDQRRGRAIHLRNRFFLLGDLFVVPFAAYLAYVLRLDTLSLLAYQPGFVVFAVCAALVTPPIFFRAGIYSRYWRYASIGELQALTSATAVATLVTSSLSVLICHYVPIQPAVPRSIPFIFLLLAAPATAFPRLLVRLLASYKRPRRPARRPVAVIFGAGDAGAQLVREWRHNPAIDLDMIGFLDDDPRKRGVRIHGLPVLGDRGSLLKVVRERSVEQVVIAMPTAPGKTIRAIVRECEAAGVRAKSIPGLSEILDGQVSIGQLRDVQIEDLLRREPVQTDTSALRALLGGKRVLVTGAGGSIGSELCRQILRFGPQQLILVGHGENSIFTIQQELLALTQPHGDQPAGGGTPRLAPATAPEIVPIIADVRFAEKLQAICQRHRPAIVFHAAAHKHVPLMEANPAEAVENNVLGTRNLLNAARAAGVERFVMISTDKAVNPTSVMGTTKRVAELLVHRAARQSGRAYVAVRFGNVLGSRGSVIPTFKRQIAAGGPVTVTHPEMKRYFMTIPEAVQLVLQAAVLGRGGEVFVLDMGEPVRIADLARDLIELSGLEVGHDIDIVYTGLRPGEKLYEELFIPGEQYRRTEHEKIFIADNASRLVPLRLDEALASLQETVARGDADAVRTALRTLVPEFRLPNENSEDALVPAVQQLD